MRTLGVMKETDARESRVALVPEVVALLIKDKLATVFVEENAGAQAGFSNLDYEAAGAVVVKDHNELINRSEYLVAVNGGSFINAPSLANKTIIGLFDPFFSLDVVKGFCRMGATIISLEQIPRISRAQSMDVLSSQANIAGYVAVLLVAERLPKVIPLMMTAAGTIKPAKILVVGAGVAGLQSIATAKRLGAVVFAYDVRAVAKEQVESLGAKFVDIKIEESGEGSGGYAKSLSESALRQQREKLAAFAKDMDAVITTAQIPGRKAPVLLDESIFSLMKKDSVIVDLASVSGGNVIGSVPNEWVRKDNVWLYGADNLARMVPKDASFTFSKNIYSLLQLVFSGQEVNF